MTQLSYILIPIILTMVVLRFSHAVKAIATKLDTIDAEKAQKIRLYVDESDPRRCLDNIYYILGVRFYPLFVELIKMIPTTKDEWEAYLETEPGIHSILISIHEGVLVHETPGNDSKCSKSYLLHDYCRKLYSFDRAGIYDHHYVGMCMPLTYIPNFQQILLVKDDNGLYPYDMFGPRGAIEYRYLYRPKWSPDTHRLFVREKACINTIFTLVDIPSTVWNATPMELVFRILRIYSLLCNK